MKQFRTFLIATALFLGATSIISAQEKIGYIDTQALIGAMPEMASAQAEIQKLGKTYENDISAAITSYQEKMKRFEAEAKTKTDEENKARLVEVQTDQQKIQELRTQAQKDLQKKEIDLLKPIQEKAMNAINKVAKAQGFKFVLDRATLIVADGTDLLPAVKSELGI